jgi:sterol desaturase/sphingolipid hydroxylase (fatty acid hydroxylase superfamily)
MSEASFDLVRLLGLFGAAAVVLALERAAPHARMRPEWRTNLGLWVAGALLTRIVCGACGLVVAEWADAHDVGLLQAGAASPIVASLAGIVALDAVSYAWHRANHRIPWLWRFHRVHHSDRAFHATTALRFHPGELLLALPVRLLAIVAFGVPVLGVLVFELVFGAMNLLEHGNFDLPARAERLAQRGFITPALHRLHHSREAVELNSNFGTILSIWDAAGSTLRRSRGDRQVETGLPGDFAATPLSLAAALALPFRRQT